MRFGTRKAGPYTRTSWFPVESVRIFDLARDGHKDEARELYTRFLPLLRLDTVPKLVQPITLAQNLVGKGSTRMRPPRLALVGAELDQARKVIRDALEDAHQGVASA